MVKYSRARITNALIAAANEAEDRGIFDESDALLKQALTIAKNINGLRSGSYTKALVQLADSYAGQCRYKEAEQLYREAVEILESELGPEHIAVGIACRNLSEILELEGEKLAADKMMARSRLIVSKNALWLLKIA